MVVADSDLKATPTEATTTIEMEVSEEGGTSNLDRETKKDLKEVEIEKEAIETTTEETTKATIAETATAIHAMKTKSKKGPKRKRVQRSK